MQESGRVYKGVKAEASCRKRAKGKENHSLPVVMQGLQCRWSVVHGPSSAQNPDDE